LYLPFADPDDPAMPLKISADASTLLIRRQSFEAHGLARSEIDALLGLTDEEFRVEGDLVAIGPVFDADALGKLVADLEGRGLVFFEDYFELSGSWPEWLSVYAMARLSA
jgi:hypothetical protein